MLVNQPKQKSQPMTFNFDHITTENIEARVAIMQDGQILLIHHYASGWFLIEVNNSPTKASIVRDAIDETAWDTDLQVDVTHVIGTYTVSVQNTLIVFGAKVIGGTLSTYESDGSHPPQFFSPQEIPRQLLNDRLEDYLDLIYIHDAFANLQNVRRTIHREKTIPFAVWSKVSPTNAVQHFEELGIITTQAAGEKRTNP